MAKASIVIGIPIDVAYVRRIPEYKDKPIITQADLAKVAGERQNDEGKETMCIETLEGLKKEYGDGKSTRCMVYNATGADLTYVLHHDWRGHVYNEKPYPDSIGNGQWGAWLHVSAVGPLELGSSGAVGPGPVIESGSSGAVVYRGKSTDGSLKDWLHCWEIQEKLGDNNVHTEVRDEGHYANADWDHIHSLLTPTKSGDDYEGCSTVATISLGNSALFTGRMATGLLLK